MTSLLTLRRPKRLFTRAAIPEGEEDPKASIPAYHTLQTFSQLPEWHQDNPNVHAFYRPISYSTLTCVHSLTYLHNETLNIYTHLLPGIFSVFAQFYLQSILSTHFPNATLEDRVVFAVNLGAATMALCLSTGYHTFMSHSQSISTLWLRIDYIGILILTVGSFISGVYVGFFEHPNLRRVYWGMILGISIVACVLVLHPRLQGLEYRALRTSAFVATGLSGFAPIGNGLWLYGWEEMWVRSGMPWWFLEGVIYGIGAVFFATRFPEQKWPGRFDVWGGSHQIFHVLVVCAAVVHLYGVWDAYGWHYRNWMTLEN